MMVFGFGTVVFWIRYVSRQVGEAKADDIDALTANMVARLARSNRFMASSWSYASPRGSLRNRRAASTERLGLWPPIVSSPAHRQPGPLRPARNCLHQPNRRVAGHN